MRVGGGGVVLRRILKDVIELRIDEKVWNHCTMVLLFPSRDIHKIAGESE